MSAYHDPDLYDTDGSGSSAAASTNAVASLQAGNPFSLLLAEDDAARTVALEALLDTVADPSTRFARATNPLRARLTLERLLIQVIRGPLEPGQPPAALIRRIAERQQTESRVILIIERAETLHPEVLQFFGRTAAMFPDDDPRLQVLFVGRPAFRPLLADPESGFDEQTAQLEQYRPAEPQPLFAPALDPAPGPAVPQRPMPFIDNSLRTQLRDVWRRGALTRVAIVGGTLIGVAAIGFALEVAITPPPDVAAVESVSSLAELDAPDQADTDPPVLQAGPPADEATAGLRREFDAYLIASGKTIDGATPAQRRATYSEFMVWRARTRSR